MQTFRMGFLTTLRTHMNQEIVSYVEKIPTKFFGKQMLAPLFAGQINYIIKTFPEQAQVFDNMTHLLALRDKAIKPYVAETVTNPYYNAHKDFCAAVDQKLDHYLTEYEDKIKQLYDDGQSDTQSDSLNTAYQTISQSFSNDIKALQTSLSKTPAAEIHTPAFHVSIAPKTKPPVDKIQDINDTFERIRQSKTPKKPENIDDLINTIESSNKSFKAPKLETPLHLEEKYLSNHPRRTATPKISNSNKPRIIDFDED
jgi:hypothetical protein